MESFRVGDPPIEVVVRRNARARRMVLRVSHASQAPTLTLPPSARLPQARAFVEEKEAWLRRQLAASPTEVQVKPGVRLPFRGGEITLVRQDRGPAVLREGRLLVSGPDASAAARAASLLRETARARCVEAVERHAQRLGRRVRRVTMRDPRGRWGSCSADGALMFSWRLILAPDAVLNYVAAHEVAHLAHMNHSPQFWAVVTSLCGDPAAHRRWLRLHGPELMRLRFS